MAVGTTPSKPAGNKETFDPTVLTGTDKTQTLIYRNTEISLQHWEDNYSNYKPVSAPCQDRGEWLSCIIAIKFSDEYRHFY